MHFQYIKAGQWPALSYLFHPMITPADGTGWPRGWPSPRRWPTSATPPVAPPASAARPPVDGSGPAPDNGSPAAGIRQGGWRDAGCRG